MRGLGYFIMLVARSRGLGSQNCVEATWKLAQTSLYGQQDRKYIVTCYVSSGTFSVIYHWCRDSMDVLVSRALDSSVCLCLLQGLVSVLIIWHPLMPDSLTHVFPEKYS